LTALAVAVPGAHVIHHNWDLGSKGLVISAAAISTGILMAALVIRVMSGKPVAAIWLMYALLVPVGAATAFVFGRTGRIDSVIMFGALVVFVFILARILNAALARKKSGAGRHEAVG
jgi:hypothetical protein